MVQPLHKAYHQKRTPPSAKKARQSSAVNDQSTATPFGFDKPFGQLRAKLSRRALRFTYDAKQA